MKYAMISRRNLAAVSLRLIRVRYLDEIEMTIKEADPEERSICAIIIWRISVGRFSSGGGWSAVSRADNFRRSGCETASGALALLSVTTYLEFSGGFGPQIDCVAVESLRLSLTVPPMARSRAGSNEILPL